MTDPDDGGGWEPAPGVGWLVAAAALAYAVNVVILLRQLKGG